jgi:hypothetical protein
MGKRRDMPEKHELLELIETDCAGLALDDPDDQGGIACIMERWLHQWAEIGNGPAELVSEVTIETKGVRPWDLSNAMYSAVLQLKNALRDGKLGTYRIILEKIDE